MAATSPAERACCGCFREEIRALRRAVMERPGNANRKCDELVVFQAGHKNVAIPIPETRMTTLATAPLAPLLDRLFADADLTEAEIAPALADLSEAEQTLMMRSKTG